MAERPGQQNVPNAVKIRKLLTQLNDDPSSGTVMNIVSDVEGEGVELIPEDRALYDKMVANPDDKNIQTETVDRVREVLEELLAIAIARGDAQEQGGRRRRNRRRTTKKRKALKKRTTRRR